MYGGDAIEGLLDHAIIAFACMHSTTNGTFATLSLPFPTHVVYMQSVSLLLARQLPLLLFQYTYRI